MKMLLRVTRAILIGALYLTAVLMIPPSVILIAIEMIEDKMEKY